jgi:hypothetical protein
LRRLLQAVEGLVEPTHQLRVHGINEVDGLRAVDGLEKSVVEEGSLDVELVHVPTLETAIVNTVRTVAGLTAGLRISS